MQRRLENTGRPHSQKVIKGANVNDLLQENVTRALKLSNGQKTPEVHIKINIIQKVWRNPK
jgi:hypothetical protein